MERPCHAIRSGNQQTSEILSILWSRHSTQFQGKNIFPRANYKPLTSLVAIYLHPVLLYSPASSYLSFLQLFQWKIQLWREIVFIILISKAWSQNCSVAEAQHLPHLQSLAWCQQLNINKFNISICFPGMTQEKIQVFYVIGMIRK